jgi:hypothetical protein
MLGRTALRPDGTGGVPGDLSAAANDDSWSAVRRQNELDAGGFQSGTDGEERTLADSMIVTLRFDCLNCAERQAGRFRQSFGRPAQSTSGTSNL